MEDPEIVAAIVAGLPAGLAAAYDRYGAGLYAYCCTKLAGPADAEGPVEDTFIAAAARLRMLGDRSELRPWLFAVARNECVRRRRARTVTLDALIGTAGTAAQASGGISDLGAAAEHAGLRRLVEVALTEMSPGNREILELDARHGLHGADLARALGVSPGAADGMTSRAHCQFEVLLGRLLALRTGRAACAEHTARLADQDVDPAAADAHIRHCAVCRGRAHTDSPAELLALVPVTEPPAGLRARILGLADDASKAGIVHRDQVARRAGPFGADGFPRGHDTRGAGLRPGRRSLVAAAALATAAVLGGGAVLATGRLGNHRPATSQLAVRAALSPSSPVNSGHPAPSPSRPNSDRASFPSAAKAPTSAPRKPAAPGSPSPAAPRRSPTPTAGTLTAPSTVTLTLQSDNSYAGTFTLAAKGGPVATYSISVTAPAVRQLAVNHPSGSLAPGQSVTETVTAAADPHGHAPEYLTLTPGGLTITVVYS